MIASALALEAKATLDDHMDSPSHMVKTAEGWSFIVPSHEAESVLNRLNTPYDTFDEAVFRGDVILIDRINLNRYFKKGYVPLQVLLENDKFIFMCKDGLVKPKERDIYSIGDNE
ncbi:hypothetical protein [Bacillus pseudomycoides]|uniref:hypothetical protein n=1 Tax=Bacillus pseudomycoides TaxID=64104 RepID=UPI002E1E1228|nr:hypothetical protein [Bacillus pseudomycoides]